MSIYLKCIKGNFKMSRQFSKRLENLLVMELFNTGWTVDAKRNVHQFLLLLPENSNDHMRKLTNKCS